LYGLNHYQGFPGNTTFLITVSGISPKNTISRYLNGALAKSAAWIQCSESIMWTMKYESTIENNYAIPADFKIEIQRSKTSVNVYFTTILGVFFESGKVLL
jgi:hypothetical protein